jgi:hypothetical protein
MKIMFYEEGMNKRRGDPRKVLPKPDNKDTWKHDETLEWSVEINTVDSEPDNDGTTIYAEGCGWYVHIEKGELIRILQSLIVPEDH